MWLTYASGALAYIIVTDQFSRNMFRDKAKAFASDPVAKAAAMAAKLRQSPVRWNGVSIALSCSTGVCDFRPGESAAEALARADEAMYAEKRARRNGAEGD